MDAGDESDESSSISSLSSVDPLDDFREKWQQEIENKAVRSGETKISKLLLSPGAVDGDEEKARRMFTEAAELEKLGKVFEAMHLYRQATHIVPDIEFKMYESMKNQLIENGNDIGNSHHDEVNGSDNSILEDLSDVDLVARFHGSIRNGNGYLFQRSNADKGVITTGFHFADLPIEIIYHILRWVVSAELDLRSLEQCALVSRGFYLCARDSEIWRLACIRVWGVQASTLKTSGYASWRQMFIERPRVCFNGCYISKTSYLRYGERSFQDQYYRPVHLIEYYRYIRFFSDGTVLMMTSADEPGQSVGKLKYRTVQRPDVLKGHYRFKDDIVILMMKKSTEKLSYNQREYHVMEHGSGAATFCIQLEMSHTKKRNIPQLLWRQYSMTQCRITEEVKSDFDLTPNKYPPLMFSRVKSYESTSDVAL